jgi:hypothetical protein
MTDDYSYSYKDVAEYILFTSISILYNDHVVDGYCCCNCPTFYFDDFEQTSLCRNCDKEELYSELHVYCEACGLSGFCSENYYDIYTCALYARDDNRTTVICQCCFDTLRNEIESIKKYYVYRIFLTSQLGENQIIPIDVCGYIKQFLLDVKLGSVSKLFYYSLF